MELKIGLENIDELVASDKLLVIDFGAEWCGPCKVLAPIVDELSTEYADRVNIGKCDVEENNDVAEKYSIRNLPTLLFIKNGSVVDKLVGSVAKDAIKTKIEEYM